MAYKKPNQAMIDRYLVIFQKAEANGKLRECFVGEDKEYRINNRDSYISSVTDPEVLLEFVLYPLYVDGNISVKGRLLNILLEFVQSNKPLEYYQAFSFLCGEMMLSKVYGEIPFELFDESIARVMMDRLSEMADKLKQYKDGDFGKYKNTMYDMVCEIINSSKLFAKNLEE